MILFLAVKENSQRVPKKNFRKLDKEPLYLKCINKFKDDYEIIVDTDSNEIYDTIKNLKNVFVYKRAHHLIGDKVSTDELIKNCVTEMDYNIDYPKDSTMCHIFATAPFLKLNTLKLAEKVYNDLKVNSLFSADIIQKRIWRKENYGMCPLNHNPLKLEQTQDLPALYIENSIFYIFNRHLFKKHNSRVCGTSIPYTINFPENVDIDTEEDYKLCETLVKGKIC